MPWIVPSSWLSEVRGEEVRLPELFQAVLSHQVVELQEGPGLAHAADHHLAEVADVRPLADRRLPEELLARVAPGDTLQDDLDVGVLTLEHVERVPDLLVLGVGEAQRHLGRGGGAGRREPADD